MSIFDRLFGSKKKTQPNIRMSPPNPSRAKSTAPPNQEPDGLVKSFRDYSSFRNALDQCQQGCDAPEWSGQLRPSAAVDNKIRNIFERRANLSAGEDSWIDLIWYKNNPSRLKRIEGNAQPAGVPFAATVTLWSDPSPHLVSALPKSTPPPKTAPPAPVEAGVQRWSVPMGTARGLMAILVKGIAYNVVTNGNRKPIQPSDQVALKATKEIEIAAGEAANNEILAKIGTAIGRNTTGGLLNLGAEFDSFQDRAFSIAKQAVIDIGKSAKGESWVLFVAQTMDACSEIGLYEVNGVLWEAVKDLTAKSSNGPIDEQAWKAAREAVDSGIFAAICAARKIAINAGIVNGWGEDAKP